MLPRLLGRRLVTGKPSAILSVGLLTFRAGMCITNDLLQGYREVKTPRRAILHKVIVNLQHLMRSTKQFASICKLQPFSSNYRAHLVVL